MQYTPSTSLGMSTHMSTISPLGHNVMLGAMDSLVNLSHFGADLILLVDGEHVGDLPSVQQVADILQEVLFLDLSVSKEEDCVIGTLCTLPQDLLQVLPPLNRGVTLTNLNLCSVVYKCVHTVPCTHKYVHTYIHTYVCT